MLGVGEPGRLVGGDQPCVCSSAHRSPRPSEASGPSIVGRANASERKPGWVGAGHPLTVALWTARRTVDQVIVVAAVQLGGSALFAAGNGPALLIPGA